MGLGHGCLFHDRQTDEGLETLHAVDVLAFIRQVIILCFIQKRAVSDIGVSHNDKGVNEEVVMSHLRK